MASGRYDITAEQGVTFKLHLRYRDSNNVTVGLDPNDGWTGRMQVRRSSSDSDLLLHITTTGITGGGSTGEFTAGSGVTGSGGITLNASATGGTGHSGGVLIGIDANSMSNVPKGNHFYDLEIVKGDTVTRLIEGRFTVDREITR
tara:strand:+ start:83 stop:517 length:435 start_codon:yes stop_codon:yes gene_type:complete